MLPVVEKEGKRRFLETTRPIWDGHLKQVLSSGVNCILIEDAVMLDAWLLVSKVRHESSFHCPFVWWVAASFWSLVWFCIKVSAISFLKYLHKALFIEMMCSVMTTVPRYSFLLEYWHSCHILFLVFSRFLHDSSVSFCYPVANTTSMVLIHDNSISPTSLYVCHAHTTAKTK